MQDLHTWMKANGETDASLAPKIGVSRVSVSRLRRGIHKASPKIAVKLEAVTKIPAAAFVFGDAR